MSVLVDTSVWSMVLRRSQRISKYEVRLAEFIENGQVEIIGPIRQEILSGVADKKVFKDLKNKLSYFPDIPIITDDYEIAAGYFNQCRKKGIQGSHIDFLICAVSVSHNLSIWTTDKDFEHFKKVLPIRLLKG